MTVTPTILVTGGTGTLGRQLVPRLLETGGPIRVLSRRPPDPAATTSPAGTDPAAGTGADAGTGAAAGTTPAARIDRAGGIERVVGDLETGAGLDAALAGVGTVVHLAGSAKGDGQKARTLAAAARRAGVGHVVFVSVVGADRLPVLSRTDRAAFGYFAAKREAEEVIAGSGIPWTTVRATQFHDFVLAAFEAARRLPVLPVFAGFRFQPVDAADVADRMVELATDRPAGLVADIAGPRVYAMTDLARGYLAATGRHRPVLPIHVPGKAARAYRAGANLSHDATVGRRTWEDFLTARFPRPA
jgi:uncharacterized protein YbjT (DUF2867 family)